MPETEAAAPSNEPAADAGDGTEAEASATDDTDALGDAGKQALDRMKNERNEYKKQARDFQKQLDEFRTSSMSEQEKAAHEAEQRGRQSATADFGKRLARTEFDALAGRRNPDVDTAQVLEYVDLAKFVGEDGEPDSKAIAAAVSRLVPEPVVGVPSFDGGSRLPAKADGDMNTFLRKATGRA